MREQMHSYQNYCVRFIEEHPEALLILEMGLGKTVISLTAIEDLMYDSFEVNKTLVIAPLRVARDVWPQEKDLWSHTRHLRMSVMIGSCRERVRALKADADVYVINRENIRWLVDYLERHHTPWPFDCVVVDEISSFKNYKSQRYKALRKARPFIKRIWGLTGTPASNGLLDLFGEVAIIDQGKRLGRFIGRYREAYFRPGSQNPYTGVIYNYVPLPGAEEAIYKKIGDISVSMKAKDFLPDLPKCLTVNHTVEMSPDEKDLYEELKKELVLTIDGKEVDAANAAVLSGRLLEMANGAVYNENHEVIRIHNKKLEMLGDLIEEAVGQNVLIAYWYQHDRSEIIEYLKEKGYTVRDLKSSEDVADWNAGKIPIALISPASAGHGLNLQHGGHILIWFSLCWSLEMRQQTDARLNRQGQTEVVTIHNIVTKDTIDEDVLKALEDKNSTQENLIRAVKARLK
ncbi:MAG: DEAD/DEAH box helicase [Lachnospiraceae bacterium]|jgi:SNF2 family DNA or RNA helicase|nr:DEAD/DEAH box helicase [Lachnospiraceae bacterium]MCH4031794.1 DEAD/DEAH box helicase [Lachnospiraceae bacterium]MCH4108348.1 DEAD/DEAH box helicase [Lachnospiraceae bacterium]MCI1380818.1 DEAD/DEAH box helicase [Lachnospiraceae bacterium]MCI1401438.1 DEAD/DEAH box helicase [Lachnospiraceae bacterium]